MLSAAAAVPPGGDCLAAQLRPGNVHSAEGWEELRLPEMDRQQKQGKQAVFRSGPGGRPGVAGAGGIAGAKAAATKAGRSRFELLECGRMGRCPQKCPSDRFFLGAGAAWRQQERPIRVRSKGGGAQRMMWGLTRGGGGCIFLVRGLQNGNSRLASSARTRAAALHYTSTD